MADDHDTIDPDDLVIDEGMPNMSHKPKSSSKLNIKIILALAAVAGVILIVMFSKSEAPPPEPLEGSDTTTSFTIKNTLGDAPKIPGKPKTDLQLSDKNQDSLDEAFLSKNEEAIRLHRQRTAKKEDIRQRKIRKGLIHFSGNTQVDTAQPLTAAQESARTLAGSIPNIQEALTPTVHLSTKAGMLSDRDMFITKGTFLDCALETAVNSTLSGMVSCRLTTNVFSTSGRVLLLERGSRITGEYQGGVKNGQARIFAIWTRVETPNGVLIDINSPGTDPLGRTGHDGYVETFFWKKFGAAILLSFIDDMSAAASSQLSRSVYAASGGTAIIPQGEAKSYSEIPSKALEDTIDIPPVLTKNQGEHINIFVARDLDFRTVYELKTDQ